jgi:5-dehydro-2-deoxygluconokinase
MASERTFDLVCMGRAAVDLYGEQLGTPLEEVSTFARYLGGSPANTAVGAARLGLAVAMLTRVGNEPNGAFVRAQLAREGVDVSQVSTDPERLTALVFLAIRDRENFPHIFYREWCADMGLVPEHVDAGFIASCGALLVSGTHLSQEATYAACRTAIEAARAAGAKVILDIDYRPVLWGLAPHAQGAAREGATNEVTARYAPILPLCDLIVGTEEEIHVAGGSTDTLAALRAIRTNSLATLVLKRGAQGSVAYAGDIPARLDGGVRGQGFAVEVFNTLGAGDSFMAGFLRGWLREEPLPQCLAFGNACGAIVVSRHGCAPAMPSWLELKSFLANGPSRPRLREDAVLEHLHRATTRVPVARRLHILAFDHRAQLEAVAQSNGCGPERIAAFKSLVADGFERIAKGRTGAGVIVDERYGEAVLARLTGRGYWIARPVEAPGSVPVAFESGMNVGLALRTWPASHVAKCLAFYHPDDDEALQRAQLERIVALAQACVATGRELLLEIIPPARDSNDALTTSRAMEAIYAHGVKPDWWKLPPSTERRTWKAVGDAIAKHDPLCRGVLVLGLEAPADELAGSFRAAVASPWVKGFAVGRSIFADAALAWFAGLASDAEVVETVARRYLEIVNLWEAAETNAARESAAA